jgi:BolA protein
MKRKKRIEETLNFSLKNWLIKVEDTSYLHKGHNNFNGKEESHFKVSLKSNYPNNKTRLQTHRLINDLLKDEFNNGLHALEIILLK